MVSSLTRRPRVGSVGVSLVLALVSGCGSSSPATTAPTTTTPATTAAPATTTAPATTMATPTTAAPATDAIGLATDDFGTHLVDPDGYALYLLLDDAQGPSTCDDGCATTWPPFTAEVTAGPGVDSTLLATVTRPDGTNQVSYSGWPLYRYTGDSAPGEANGQGLAGQWFLVDVDGNPIGQAS